MFSSRFVLSTKFTYVLLILLSASLYSFSLVPANKQEAAPPIEAKTLSKRQKRLHKRHNRLYQRFDQAQNSRQQAHLQKKIRQVEQQLETPGTPIWGALGLGFGILAFFCVFAAGVLYLPGLMVLGLLVAITGLIFSIVSIVFNSKDPKRYILKGLGIAGIIVSSIMLLSLVVAIITTWL